MALQNPDAILLKKLKDVYMVNWPSVEKIMRDGKVWEIAIAAMQECYEQGQRDATPVMSVPSNHTPLDEKIRILSDRAKKFKVQVMENYDGYSERMLEDFFLYWTESNPAYTKLRFEMEHVFVLGDRLKAWKTASKNRVK